MLQRIHTVLYHTTRVSAWVGMLFLLGAMAVTTTDVVLRKIDSAGIYGSVDLVQLMIMGAAYLSIPYGFLTHGHVSVSIVVDSLNRRGAALANLLAATLGTGFMFAIAYFSFQQAMMQVEYGDISLTLGVPKVYYWIPLLFGSALSAAVCVYMSIEALIVIISGRSRLTPNGNGKG